MFVIKDGYSNTESFYKTISELKTDICTKLLWLYQDKHEFK